MNKDIQSKIEDDLVSQLAKEIDKHIIDVLMREERELRERIDKREKKIDELLNDEDEQS